MFERKHWQGWKAVKVVGPSRFKDSNSEPSLIGTPWQVQSQDPIFHQRTKESRYPSPLFCFLDSVAYTWSVMFGMSSELENLLGWWGEQRSWGRQGDVYKGKISRAKSASVCTQNWWYSQWMWSFRARTSHMHPWCPCTHLGVIQALTSTILAIVWYCGNSRCHLFCLKGVL